MINRIESAFQEIIKWKKRFDELFSFSQEVRNGRDFKLAELGMYNRLLDRKYPSLSRDEKLMKKMVRGHRRQLVKQLYPNPLVRMVRRLFDRSVSVGRRISQLLQGDVQKEENSQLLQQIDRLGFTGLGEQLGGKLAEGQRSFTIQQLVSKNETEMLKYSLNIAPDDRGRLCVESFELARQSGTKLEHFKFTADDGINSSQAAELAGGRSVYVGSNNWQMIDFNDRDAQGNYVVRKINVPDFDMEKELDNLRPISGSAKHLIEAIQQGKRVEVEIEVRGNPTKFQLEAQPLKRTLQLYRDGRKYNAKLDEVPANGAQGKPLKISHKQGRNEVKVGR
ncbi:hypothetical protein [Pedobacter chitinilyticus]|uniref:DUF3945 domain-containing protein n=1 Tax=Pedobacter chitinilyticus TaxID=2233776 RepID=A0A3S3SUU3_9SPHI|nr:hypothetical protein [Pedobacter chitinilyticus]RWU08124.1 hypothetical protein DPV69_07015 [Pedobacter chitinilyticus]